MESRKVFFRGSDMSQESGITPIHSYSEDGIRTLFDPIRSGGVGRILRDMLGLPRNQ